MSGKLAASDFDGTLFRDGKILAEDVAAIRRWRAAGNRFGIVTGRPLIMLAPCLEIFGVEVDFMVCDNGAIIHGGDGRVIFESGLSTEFLRDVINEPSAAKSFHFAFEAADKMFCIVNSDKSWIPSEVRRWNFPLTIIDAAQVPTLPNINQLALVFAAPEEAQVAADALNQKFGDTIAAQRNFTSVDIVPAGIDKARGVENLLRLTGWRAEILVIGDESNDLPMIKTFGGYTVASAKDFVRREAKAVFDSVGDMLKNFLDKI